MYIYTFIHIQKNFKENEFIDFIMSFKFDSNFNSKILFINNIFSQLEFIIKNIDNIKNKSIKIDVDNYMQTLKIYEEIGPDIISDFKNINIKHNVLKFIIYKKIYLIEDKLEIYKFLETEELTHLEYKYIEIVDSNIEVIDYSSIENLLKDNKNDFVETIYNMLVIQDDTSNKSLDYKINELFNKKIIIPITDDFLRYNKENEKYDSGLTNIEQNVRTNKNDNTKLRYIISKINKVIDYYNLNKKEDIFYQPLANRKAILINDLEEMNIIKKIYNQGKIQNSQNEYLNELLSFRTYPYINFKDFKQNGFSLKTNKTIEAIRYTNLEFKNDPKYNYTLKNNLECRVIPSDSIANIIGIAIPLESQLLTNTITRDHDTIIQCILTKNTYDIKKNNIMNTVNLIKNQILNTIKYNKLPYWIFNKEIDKLQKFREIYNFNQDDYYKSFKIISKIQNKLLNLNLNNYNYIYSYIFLNKSTSFKYEYDLQEDRIPGITIKLLKIPSFPPISKKANIINITSTVDNTSDEDFLNDNTYCQHNITWDKITTLRNKFPNKFNQALYDFIKHFNVIENADKDFICSSCSEVINLKKYINDWTSSTEEGIALSLSLNTKLTELPEYEKYIKVIDNLDKVIEKICSGLNFLSLIGNKPQIKIKRQEIIKMLIDLINIQNETMKDLNITDRKNRLEMANKKYGIIKEYSQFFLFELKNDIFIYSSKDTDKFKKPKINNIMTYIILLLINEINLSLILYFPEDKMLNYFIFDRLGFNLFDGLLIRINSSNDVSYIKNYKLLCYVIYILSGILLKYNLWFSDLNVKKGMINPTDQKIIINTLVDLLNSILEINTTKNKNFLYEMFASRFFSKLNQVYSKKVSSDVIIKLDNMSKKKISIVDNKKIIFKTSKNIINTTITGHYEKIDFGNYKWLYNKPIFFFKKINKILKLTPKQINEYQNILNEQTLIKYFKKYNLDTSMRFDIIPDEDIKNMDKNKINELKLKIINDKLQNKFKENNKIQDKIFKTIENIDNNINIYNEKKNKDDIYQIIENLIVFWEDIIGKNININNENIYLRQNVYIINHNFRGNNRDDIITIVENDNKIIFKKDDQFFKQNIYYYFDKVHNLTMYYNAQDYNYLGYKEQGKDYVRIYGSSCVMQVKLAIKNKLLFLGYSYLNYKIPNDILILLKSDNLDNLKIAGNKLLNYISEITRERINNLKNSLLNVQKILYQIKNKINIKTIHPISKNYINKFQIITFNSFFSDINNIFKSIFFTKIDTNTSITYEKEHIYVGNLIKIKNSDHYLIIYLCNQIKDIIDINSDIYTKKNLIYLFSNIINNEFNFHNLREKANSNPEVKKFTLMESNFYNIFDENETDIFENLSEDESDEIKEEKYDDKEKNDALDVDLGDIDDDDPDEKYEQLSRTYFVGEIE